MDPTEPSQPLEDGAQYPRDPYGSITGGCLVRQDKAEEPRQNFEFLGYRGATNVRVVIPVHAPITLIAGGLWGFPSWPAQNQSLTLSLPGPVLSIAGLFP